LSTLPPLVPRTPVTVDPSPSWYWNDARMPTRTASGNDDHGSTASKVTPAPFALASASTSFAPATFCPAFGPASHLTAPAKLPGTPGQKPIA
jgi:hypothetical protein